MSSVLSSALFLFDSASSDEERLAYAGSLAEAVRSHLGHTGLERKKRKRIPTSDVDDDDAPEKRDYHYQFGLFKKKPFLYKGITYDYCMNAFQAQKVPDADKHKFADVDPSHSAVMSRDYKIDVQAWDAGRLDLMKDIVREQATQHSDMAHFLVKHRNDVIAPSGIGLGGFWEEMMKAAYKHAGETLHTAEPAEPV